MASRHTQRNEGQRHLAEVSRQAAFLGQFAWGGKEKERLLPHQSTSVSHEGATLWSAPNAKARKRERKKGFLQADDEALHQRGIYIEHALLLADVRVPTDYSFRKAADTKHSFSIGAPRRPSPWQGGA